MADADQPFAVVLAGGRGERLWPLVRADRPKPLLSVQGRSLLAATLERVAALGLSPERTMIVGSQSHADALAAEAPGARLVLEPDAKDTARAVALAALVALQLDADPILWVLPSDHVVPDVEPVVAAVRTAIAAARRHALLFAFGAPPQSASTAYGWLLPGAALDAAHGAFRLDEYVEKPEAELAASLHAGGRHLLSCGMFVLPAKALLDAMRRFAPELLADAERIAAGRSTGPRGPHRSLDHAILEPATRAGLCGVVPLRYARVDVGRLDGLAGLMPQDPRGNATAGDVLALDSARCMLASDGALLAALGLQDLVVIAERDVVLVCAHSRTAEARRIVAELAARGRQDLL